MHREYDPTAMGLDQIVTGGQSHGHEQGQGHHHDHHHHDHDPAAEHRRLLILTVLVGLLLAGHLLLPFWRPEWARPFGVPLGLLAAVLGGGRIIYQALAALFEGRVGADIALAIATIAAAVMGEYFVAAEVVFIALVGECLEAYAFGRAQRAIQKLLDLRPRVARVLRDGQEQEIAVESLRVGDSLIVRPGERIAADGAVVAGRSAVDQSTLTGESLPVDKGPGDPVYTGTINAFGCLEIRAEKVGAETTLGQVIRLLTEAQRRKSPLERTADRYARLFLPAVLAAAAIVFIGTNFGAIRSWATTGAMAGRLDVLPLLAVLVVACPCALILATPAAVLAATARLARRGVLVKGGAAIERLAAVNCLAFDKTGTLTEGKPELGDTVTFAGWEAAPLLRLAAAAEQSSEHPLARLLVKEARRQDLTLPAVADFLAHPGAGVAAGVENRTVLVGNLRLFREQDVPLEKAVETAIEALDASGQTALLVAVDGQVAGIFGARDRVRQEAHGVVHDLKHLGLKDQTILTGDRAAPAQAIARKVHLKAVESELTPGAKADWVHRKQEEGRVVAMIGDGINDAPALAMADVGIALGGVGTDIAAEAGSIVLMGDPLAPLPDAIRLARRTVAIIRQNILFFAFGLNAVAVLLAGLRVLGPVAAAIVHQIGSFLVILNAIRLLGSEGWEQFGPLRALASLQLRVRRFHPDDLSNWIRPRRRGLAVSALGLAAAVYALSGLTVIGPDQVGLLQRFGQYQKALEPGLHWRRPLPFERVTRLEPEQVRVARVGLSSGAQPASGAVAWSASHGESPDDAALFLTGDENLVELAGVVEYRYGREHLADLYFQTASLDLTVQAAADGAFREAVGRAPLESILVADRTAFESQVRDLLQTRLTQCGLPMRVERVRIIDAHPPKEVVPAYRDVSAAVSDAARYNNEAQSYAAQQEQAALADARGFRDSAATQSHQLESSARGQQAAFLARQQAHASQPDLTEFRLLWNTLAESYASRPKLILDSRAAGRRMLWLADPDRFGLNAGAASLAQPAIPDGNDFPMD